MFHFEDFQVNEMFQIEISFPYLIDCLWPYSISLLDMDINFVSSFALRKVSSFQPLKCMTFCSLVWPLKSGLGHFSQINMDHTWTIKLMDYKLG